MFYYEPDEEVHEEVPPPTELEPSSGFAPGAGLITIGTIVFIAILSHFA